MRAIRMMAVAGLLAILLFCGGVSCLRLPFADLGRASWAPPQAVKVTGPVTWIGLRNLVGPVGAVCKEKGDTNHLGMLICDGDFLLVSTKTDINGKEATTDSLFLYRRSDGPLLAFTYAPQRLVLGDRTVTLDLSDNEVAGWDWLRQAAPAELRALRLVALPADLGQDASVATAREALLRKLAAANPEVGLVTDDPDNPFLGMVFSLFRPRQLVASGCPDTAAAQAKFLAVLGRQAQLETLAIEAKNISSLAFLSRLPRLRRLILTEWDPAKTGPLPEQCAGLRTLAATLEHPQPKSLAAIVGLTALEELELTSTGALDLAVLNRMPWLRHLSLFCGEKIDLAPLRALPHLTWLGLPVVDLSPAEFAALLEAVPSVHYLDVWAEKENTNLASVTRLPDLEALTVYDEFDPGALPLETLKKLRFLALPNDAWKNQAFAARVAQFEKEHPACQVVKLKPLCLGSGWILLLALTAGVSFLARRRQPAGPWSGRAAPAR